MFIHHIEEGQKKHLGLNWMSNEMTFILFILRIPIWITKRIKYFGFNHDNLYFGSRIKIFSFYFRIRRWKNFPPNIKRIICHYYLDSISFGRQYFLCTRELIEDSKCQ